MANERIIVPNKEHHHTGPSNGQESRIVTRIWQSVLAAHNNSIENYFQSIPETRTDLFYVPPWQPEAPQYLSHTNGRSTSQFKNKAQKLAKVEAV